MPRPRCASTDSSPADRPKSSSKEHSRRMQRRRRAVAANIFACLRSRANYNLPHHCHNNEVLRALCAEAGWIVDPRNGNTYRRGTPPHQRPNPMEIGGTSTNPTRPSPPMLRLSNSAPKQTINFGILGKKPKHVPAPKGPFFAASSAPVGPTVPKSTELTLNFSFQAYTNPVRPSLDIFDYLPPTKNDAMPDKGKGKVFHLDTAMAWRGQNIHGGLQTNDLELTLGNEKPSWSGSGSGSMVSNFIYID